jgi:hypothetical protein
MKQYSFYIAVLIITIFGFLLFVPKVATRVFPFARNRLLKNFLDDTKNKKTIDARKFWILREYYSPGSFVFKEKGLTDNETNSALKQYEFIFNNQQYVYPFLIFNSDKFQSMEALVKATNLNSVIQNSSAKNLKNCIIDQKTARICYRNEHELEVRFIKPMNEMRQTNGFFDYKRQDLAELTNGKYWLVISKISL